MKQVLLTGAAGKIGTAILQELGEAYQFRCLDRKPCVRVPESLKIDILEFEQVLAAMQSMNALIHLAANPDPGQSWHEVYTTGIAGTYNLFEAARLAGVKKIIYASSAHVLGFNELDRGEFVKPDDRPHPDSLYGVGKACGEALGQFFADQYGISVICIRIGCFSADIRKSWLNDRLLGGYCSSRDLAQLVQKSLEAEQLGFEVFYGVSANQHRLWDIQNAQQLLGYEPQDDVEAGVPLVERRQKMLNVVAKQLRETHSGSSTT